MEFETRGFDQLAALKAGITGAGMERFVRAGADVF